MLFVLLPAQETETVGAKRPKASFSERAGITVEMTARSLLEALANTWPKLVRSDGGEMDLKTVPTELKLLAEKHRERDKLLEHPGKFLL